MIGNCENKRAKIRAEYRDMDSNKIRKKSKLQKPKLIKINKNILIFIGV